MKAYNSGSPYVVHPMSLPLPPTKQCCYSEGISGKCHTIYGIIFKAIHNTNIVYRGGGAVSHFM